METAHSELGLTFGTAWQSDQLCKYSIGVWIIRLANQYG